MTGLELIDPVSQTDAADPAFRRTEPSPLLSFFFSPPSPRSRPPARTSPTGKPEGKEGKRKTLIAESFHCSTAK
jgi:hypothetical protein